MELIKQKELPTFQERLDVKAEDLIQLSEVFKVSINKIYNLLYVIKNNVEEENRPDYVGEDESFVILDVIKQINSEITSLQSAIAAIDTYNANTIATINASFSALETRINALDDACARKDDLAVLSARINS